MLGEQIKAARADKYSDDEILSFLAESRPELADPIKQAVADNYSAKQILDHLAPNKGYGAALQYGVGAAVEGVGKTIKQGGRAADIEGIDSFGQSVERTGAYMRPDNYRTGIQEFTNPTADEKGLGGFGWSGIPRAAIEGAPVLGAMLLTKNPWLAGGLYGSTSLGGNIEQRMVNNNRDPNKDKATGSELLAAGATTAAESALGGLGAGRVAGPLTGGVFQGAKQFGKAVGTEMAVGAGQDIVNQLGTSVGTEKGVDYDWKQTLGNTLSQGLTTVGLKTPALARNAATALELRGVDNRNNQATYAANLLRQVQETNPTLSISNVKDTGQILEKALAVNSQRITDSVAPLKELLKQANNANALNGIDALVQNAQSTAIVKDSKKRTTAPIGEEAVRRIESLVGHTAEGQLLASSLRAQAALKAVGKQGTKVGDSFVGGIAAKLPGVKRLAQTKGLGALTLGTGAVGALASSTPIVQGAIASFMANPLPALAAAAIPAGIYGAARGIDALAGSRNPVERFARRFEDPTVGTAPSSNAPSVSQQVSAAKAQRQLQQQQLANQRLTNSTLQGAFLAQRNAMQPGLTQAQLQQRLAQAAAANARAQATTGNAAARQNVMQAQAGLYNAKAAGVNQTSQARADATRMNAEGRRGVQDAQANVYNAKAEAIPVITEGQRNLLDARTKSVNDQTQGRLGVLSAQTDAVTNLGTQRAKTEEARTKTQLTKSEIAALEKERAQLRVEMQAAKTDTAKAMAASKIAKIEAQLAEGPKGEQTGKGSGTGSGKTGEPQSGKPLERDNNTSLIMGIQNAVGKIQNGKTKARVKADLERILDTRSLTERRAIIDDVAKRYPKYASEIISQLDNRNREHSVIEKQTRETGAYEFDGPDPRQAQYKKPEYAGGAESKQAKLARAVNDFTRSLPEDIRGAAREELRQGLKARSGKTAREKFVMEVAQKYPEHTEAFTMFSKKVRHEEYTKYDDKGANNAKNRKPRNPN